MLVRRTTRGRSQRSEIARGGDGRSVSLMSEITLSKKPDDLWFFYRAVLSYLHLVSVGFASVWSGLICPRPPFDLI